MEKKKVNFDELKKQLLENKIVLIACIVIILLVIIVISSGGKKLTCTLDNEIIEGFNNKEKITVKWKKNEISKINLDKTVSISDFYKEYGTYIESLKTVMTNGYEGAVINDTDSEVTVKYETTDKSIVPNALSINYNADDKTSLRYDIDTNYDNGIQVGSKESKSDIKTMLKKAGYKCR